MRTTMTEPYSTWHVQTAGLSAEAGGTRVVSEPPVLCGGVWEFCTHDAARVMKVLLLVPSANVLYIKRIGA